MSVYALRRNASLSGPLPGKVTPLQAVLRYRDLLTVENLFLRTKAVMRTRPIFHSSDAAIRGHCFVPFWRLPCRNTWKTCYVSPSLRRNGKRCCAISIACNTSVSTIAIATGWCASMSPNRYKQP